MVLADDVGVFDDVPQRRPSDQRVLDVDELGRDEDAGGQAAMMAMQG